MTLREQIKELHLKRFGKEFHDHRGSNTPAMVKDLIQKQWEDLQLNTVAGYSGEWYVANSVEVRAVKKAWELINSIGLRECTPAVE